jgi:hypothetical protein
LLPSLWLFAVSQIDGVPAGVGNKGEVVEELFALCFRQDTQDLFLQFESNLAGFDVFPFSGGLQLEAVCAAILFVSFSLDQAGGLHAFQQRCDRVGIAGDEMRKFALGNAFVLKEGAQHGKLVGRNFEMGNAAAKSLVETVPGAPEQRGQALAFR